MTDRITPRQATQLAVCRARCLSVCLWLGVRVNVFAVPVRCSRRSILAAAAVSGLLQSALCNLLPSHVSSAVASARTR